MRKGLTILGLLAFVGLQAQKQNKVGINTENPTEQLDVNGTMRVRMLPYNRKPNAIHTKEDGANSVGRTETYKAKNIVRVDANGVFGVIDVDDTVVDVVGSASNAMFVKKLYSATFPVVNKDTGFSSDKWIAVLNVIGYNNSNGAKLARKLLTQNGDGLLLNISKGNNGNWVVDGQLPEGTGINIDYEILYINAEYAVVDDAVVVIQ